MDVSTPEKATKVGDHLLGLACGHFWPGKAESDERASELLALFIATGDSSRCPYCRTQQRITGPLAKVLDDAGTTWRHSDGTECVAGHDADTMQCVEGGGVVNRGGSKSHD